MSRSIPKYTNINPFISSLPLYPRYEIIKCILMAPIAIIKFLVIIIILLLMYICSLIIVCNIKQDKLFSNFQNFLVNVMRYLSRALLFVFGFYKINFYDFRENNNNKSAIIVANHCSMFDQFIISNFINCSGASKHDNFNLAFMSTMLKATQCISIDRTSPESRQDAINKIKERALNKNLPPLIVFPQGTTCVNSCLTSFKPGAFLPGVSIQPVCLMYNFKQLDLYYGFKSDLYYIFMTLCQFVNYATCVFLPVYDPSQDEINNAELYANNVRDSMNKLLTSNLSNHSYADIRLIRAAMKKDIAIDFTVQDAKDYANITLDEILEHMKIYDKSNNISFREYLNNKIN